MENRSELPKAGPNTSGLISGPRNLPPGFGVRWLAGNGADTAFAWSQVFAFLQPFRSYGLPESGVCPHPSPTALQDASRSTQRVRLRSEASCRPADVLLLCLLLLSTLGALAARPAPKAPLVLLEAEQFANLGGWVVDQQFMDQMGSPYLLAHGLGEPVRDAETTVQFPAAGTYHMWVRTRDWVAPWKAPGAPGRFKVLVNGKPLGTTFGTEGAEWHWQDGGTVKVGREATLALHDLTGFEGRCDAILFASDRGLQATQ